MGYSFAIPPTTFNLLIGLAIMYHTFIAGATGSGKTYYSRLLIKDRDIPYLIYFNSGFDLQIEKACDFVVSDIRHLIKILKKEPDVAICYNPSGAREVDTKKIEEIQSLVFNIGLKLNKDKIKQWLIFCIDEIQLYDSKQKPNNIVESLYTRGRRYGIVMVGISQRPALVSHTVLTQSREHIYFRFPDYEKPYTKKYFGERIDEYWDWLDKDYHYIKITDGQIKKYLPVK